MFAERVKSVYDTMSPSEPQKERLLRMIASATNRGSQAHAAFRLRGRKIAFLPLVAIILLVLSSTALAVAAFTGAIDWKGNRKEEAPPSPTVAPATEKSDFSAETKAMKLLSGCAENELWIVRFSGADGNQNAASVQRTRKFASLDAMNRALASCPVRFVFPARFPGGYLFCEGKLTYECAASYSYTLLGSKVTADGLVLERYQTAPEADVTSGYLLILMNAAGDTLRITASLANSRDDVGFGVTEDDEYTTLSVSGMDDAVCVERPTDTNLYTRQTLPSPIAYRDIFSMMQESGDGDGIGQFDEVHYAIYATALKASDILKALN